MKIISPYPDLHSGIEGGAVAEPMIDMYVPFMSMLSILTRISGSNSWDP